VVHATHGVARYEGMVARAIGGVQRDYLLLAYRGDDKLYVPTDQIDVVRHYTGGDSPALSKMGGADWQRTRSRVKSAVREIAQELVVLYQRRLATPGHAFMLDTPWQRELSPELPRTPRTPRGGSRTGVGARSDAGGKEVAEDFVGTRGVLFGDEVPAERAAYAQVGKMARERIGVQIAARLVVVGGEAGRECLWDEERAEQPQRRMRIGLVPILRGIDHVFEFVARP